MKLQALCFALFAMASNASPLEESNTLLAASSRKSEEEGKTSSWNLDDFKRYAQYAGASYCEIGKVGRPTFCKGDICLRNAITYGTFSGSTTDISAYMAIDEPNQDIIIGVRGSSNLYNWVTDLRFLQTSCEYGVACRAHRGFLDAAQDIIDDNFYDSVRDALKDYPRANITVSGHSLGGAVALLLGVYIRENWPKRTVHIYTYGAPRVGNVPFMNYIHNQENGRTFRITHFDDVVPRLPPMSYLDYGHSSAEYWLPYGPADRVDYTEDQVVECTGYDNSDCSGSGWYPGLRSHLYYLVAITHCGGSHSRLSLGNSPIESWNGTALDKDAIERLEMFALMDQQYAAAVAYISDQDS